MTNPDDKLPESMRAAARDYNDPPALNRADVDDMWSAIESEAFPKRFRSPTAEHLLPRAESRAPRAWFTARSLLPLAAVLVLGVAIGRFGFPRKSPASVVISIPAPSKDSLAVPDAYQTTTSRYLGQTTALLVALPAEAGDRANDLYLNRAHDLLLTTRLLLDSPAAADPRFRTLLEDLELVLAQVVRLHSEQSRAELDLIRQALEQRDVLPRLRTAVADISADD